MYFSPLIWCISRHDLLKWKQVWRCWWCGWWRPRAWRHMCNTLARCTDTPPWDQSWHPWQVSYNRLWADPRWVQGWILSPLTGAQPVLVRMVLGSCGNPVSSLARTGLHCTGKGQARGERRWKWEGRSRRASWENKRRTLHIAPSDQWGRGLRSIWWQITGWSLIQQWQWPHSQALLHRCVSPPSILIRWCYHCHYQFQWISFKISSWIGVIY